MRIRSLSALLAVGMHLAVQAQIPALKPGDKIPDIYLGKFLNEPGKKMKFSDIHAKLTILDFWNTHCTVCLTDMPKLDSIQKKYQSQVQVLAITKNTESEVNRLLSRVKVKKADYPFIVNDTLFNQLFPHSGDPLHVWIDDKGKILAVTFDFETNLKNVGEYLAGDVPDLLNAQEHLFDVDYPLLSEQNSSLISSATDYSVLYSSKEMFRGEMAARIQPNLISITNTPFSLLYTTAYSPLIYGQSVNVLRLEHDNRILLEVADQSQFTMPGNEDEMADWVRKSVVSYELKTSSGMPGREFQLMQHDLSRYFPFSAKVERRKERCLALMVTDRLLLKRLKNFDKGTKPKIDVDSPFSMQNMPVHSFIMELIYANRFLKVPIVDRTGITGNISVTLKSNLSDLTAVDHELSNYGLQLKETITDIPMLVIRDKKKE